MDDVALCLSDMLRAGKLQTYAIHPETNPTVKRWNKALNGDLPCFMATMDSNWDEHVVLAWISYIMIVCAAPSMTQ